MAAISPDLKRIVGGDESLPFLPCITTPEIEFALRSILNCPYQEPIRQMYLEAKTLEVIALVLEFLLADRQTSKQPLKLEQCDIDRKGEKRLKFHQRRVSRKKKGSSNRKKAINRLGRVHLKISRQRQEQVKRLARCVIQSNDLVAYEDLRIKNLVKNHCLAKSINDAGWYQFRKWLEYFGRKFGKVTVAVNPAWTSQKCSDCGTIVKKSLSTRTHVCRCGCELDRDWNAAINILKSALSTLGHSGTWVTDPNAPLRFDRY